MLVCPILSRTVHHFDALPERKTRQNTAILTKFGIFRVHVHNVLKCVVTEVVLFSIIVAFKTLDISQGSVATHLTHLRCGGIFGDSIITNFLLILILK